MKQLIVVVLLLDVALAVAFAAWQHREPAPAPEPTTRPARPSQPNAAQRILQRQTDLPWWMQNPTQAHQRYAGYRLTYGTGKAATQTLAHDQATLRAMERYRELYGEQSSSNELDNVTMGNMVTLDEAAREEDGRWTVHVLLGHKTQAGD